MYLIISSQFFTSHVSFTITASSVEDTEGVVCKPEKEPFDMAELPLRRKNLAITAFQWQTVKKLNTALTEHENILFI